MTNLPVPYPQGQAVTGVDMTAAFYNTNVANGLAFLSNVPICQVYQTASQTVASAYTKLAFQATVVDSYTGWNAANNYYVAQVAGWYRVDGFLSLVAGSNSGFCAVYVNGTVVKHLNHGCATGAAGGGPVTNGFVYLNAGDNVALYGWANTSTGSLGSGFNQVTSFMVQWIHY